MKWGVKILEDHTEWMKSFRSAGRIGHGRIKGCVHMGRLDEGLSNRVFRSRLLCFRPGHANVGSENVPLVWAYETGFMETQEASSDCILSYHPSMFLEGFQITRREDER